MRIHSRMASIVWKVVLLAFGAYGLLDGSGILAGAYEPGFPHMFTNVSNLFAWVYFLLAVVWLVRHRENEDAVTFAPQVKYTATISLLITMLIAHFLLFDAMFQDGQLVWHLVFLHYLVPIMSLLDWALFDQKGRMPVWGPLVWLSLAVVYLVIVLVGAGPLGMDLGGGTTADITRYPYTFLDPAIAGVGGVAGFCVVMIVAFAVLGYVLFGIDRLMGKAARN
ncbi:MAG: Pr6Pr family membrane protein [Coriobacteriales bacterium]|nr:Pr6Pr family membrane protein [Coriobacteriales bacterium]